MTELDIDNSLGIATYTSVKLSEEEIRDNLRSVLYSFGISSNDKKLHFTSLY